MGELKITKDPEALAFLLTEELYSIREKAGSGAIVREEAEAITGKQADPAEEKDIGKELPEQPVLQEKASEEVFHYLGENRRFVLVLVNYPGEKYLPEAEKAYLEKILSAVKLNLEDIALLNYARYPGKKYAELKDFFAFANLLLLGIAPYQLNIPGPVLPYHLGIVEGVKILAADSAEVFRPDPQKKKQLWAELQRTFL